MNKKIKLISVYEKTDDNTLDDVRLLWATSIDTSIPISYWGGINTCHSFNFLSYKQRNFDVGKLVKEKMANGYIYVGIGSVMLHYECAEIVNLDLKKTLHRSSYLIEDVVPASQIAKDELSIILKRQRNTIILPAINKGSSLYF